MPAILGETLLHITLQDMALFLFLGGMTYSINCTCTYKTNIIRFLVEEGISLVRKQAKISALKDMRSEDYIECKLSLLSKVV